MSLVSYNKPKILSNESKFDNFDISSGSYHPSNEGLDAKVKGVEEGNLTQLIITKCNGSKLEFYITHYQIIENMPSGEYFTLPTGREKVALRSIILYTKKLAGQM